MFSAPRAMDSVPVAVPEAEQISPPLRLSTFTLPPFSDSRPPFTWIGASAAVNDVPLPS